MADFSRRVPLDELRGRGLMKGLQPEVSEKVSRCPSAYAHGDEACTQLIEYTDGSACVDKSLAKFGGRRQDGSRYLCRGRYGGWLAALGGQSRRIPLLSWALRVRAAQSLRLPPSRAC